MNVSQIDRSYMNKLYGYVDDDTVLVPNSKVLFELQDISDMEKWKDTPKIKIKQRRKRDILKESKNFFNRYFKLHRIPYKSLLTKLDIQIMLNVDNVVTAAKICNATNLFISPFMLPVSFSGIEETDTMVVVNAQLIDDNDFYDNIDISYRKIILNRNVTDLSVSSYVHEITHTQLSKVRGIIKYYVNSEVLPIFLELLSLYDSGNKDLILLGDLIRLNELIDHVNVLYSASLEGVEISGGDLTSSTVYTESILKAYDMFIMYINGSNSFKKYILNSIQNILNGDLQLEEILDELEVTETSVLEDKKLYKYFER